MKLLTENLINDLIERTQQVLNDSENLKKCSLEQLNHKPTPESWSALECIEHLNLYGDFYLPEMDKKMKNTKYSEPEKMFKSGWLGNYFANSLLPKENLNRMNSPSDKNPAGSKLSIENLNKFIDQQHQTLELLNKARKVNLNKTKTGITLTQWIKLRLGDTFRVVIYHNQRHIIQAQKAIKTFTKTNSNLTVN